MGGVKLNEASGLRKPDLPDGAHFNALRESHESLFTLTDR
jgi:hypothetical protein